MSEGVSYKESGVDIEKAEEFVRRIKKSIKDTCREGVLSEIGHFGALFEVPIARYRKPVLVSSTDGVGTKLKVAFMANRHDTVGIDLVAMSVNDILTLGAEPLFFLDYFATGRLDSSVAEDVIKGIVEGCKEAGCALIGGETAEMPGFYRDGEYDLSGFAVGIVEKEGIIDGGSISEGDAVIGLASSGLHSNGYSLVRKILFEIENLKIDLFVDEIGRTLSEELLEPTKIYVNPVMELLKEGIKIKGMAHITGGGIPGNLSRILPEDTSALIYRKSWEEPPIFRYIQRLGRIDEAEMDRTFNRGIGFIIITSEEDTDRCLEKLRDWGERAYRIGRIVKGHREVIYEIV